MYLAHCPTYGLDIPNIYFQVSNLQLIGDSALWQVQKWNLKTIVYPISAAHPAPSENFETNVQLGGL